MSEPKQEVRVERERLVALAKLGLAAGIAYTAPTIVRLDLAMAKKGLPSPCPPPGGGGKTPKGC